MPSLDDLKKRISSVKSTQKITKAMKMVAAAKLRRAQENAEKGRPFSEKMNNIILNLSNAITDKENASKFLEKLGNPYYLTASDEEGKTAVVFGIYGIPESILIDSNLKVIAKFIGPLTEDDYKNIKEIIK